MRLESLLFLGERGHNFATAEARRILGPKQILRRILMKRFLYLSAFLVLTAVVARPLLAEDNPFLGTWNLNSAKSKFEGVPGPKNQTRTVTAEGTGVKYSFQGVAADGSPIAFSFVTNYDGKDSAVTGAGTPAGADSISLRRVSSHKIEGTLKKGGKEVGKVTAEVSPDGKVSTVKGKGKTPDGKEYSTESIYEKQ
jgi:hypothetical protein